MNTNADSRDAFQITDCGYLLCFGAVPHGLSHLRTIFGSGLAAPPAVKAELLRLGSNQKKSLDVRSAAARFTGRAAGILADILLTWHDVPERDAVLMHLSGSHAHRSAISLTTPPQAELLHRAKSGAPVPVTSGDNAGEAEAIAVSVRTGLPLLMTDGKATQYARGRGVEVESAARSLLRLKPSLTPRQLFGICREMERRVGDVGDVVKGPMWFSAPAPTTATQVLASRSSNGPE